MTGILRRLFHRADGAGGGGEDGLSYERARELAQSGDPEVRRRLAARDDVVPEILYYLAEDPSVEVRREIANNRSAPAQANLMLATDADVAVRSRLAQKISMVAPGLTAAEQDRLRRMSYETLQLLARDQVTRVRQLLSEALKDIAHAPPDVIRRLARDAELAVAGPVLENSPVLTDDDLLEIIATQPVAGALSAISRRPEVRARVADAIAASDDAEAIADLLANPCAQIREETLDGLIERAPQHEKWHGPLVNRPHLPARAAARLARFVADSLMQRLEERHDLDPETAAAVAAAVHKRLEERGPPEARPAGAAACVPVDSAADLARQMQSGGGLDDKVLAQALAANDREFVVGALAARAGVPLEVAQKIVVTQSPKGLVSLAWKADVPMPLAVQLQVKLARIPPSDVLGPVRDAPYPLAEEEMAWQLKFFSSLAGQDV